MRALGLILLVAFTVPASADLRITRDHGGVVDQYKAKYARVRDKGDASSSTASATRPARLVLGMVPLSRICVTPRASLGFHQAYFDKSWTAGIRVTSVAGTDELMSVLSADRQETGSSATAGSPRK